MSKNVQHFRISEHSHSHGQKFMALENTKTDFFTDLVTFDVWFAAPKDHGHQLKMKRTLLAGLKSNIQCVSQLQSGNLYIEHLFWAQCRWGERWHNLKQRPRIIGC
jgi:hypothetical protein